MSNEQMTEVLIQANQVKKEFQTGSVKNRILDAIDLSVYRNDFTIIMGASGAGKSTLLYALSGMDDISSGQVYFKDQEISRLKEKDMAQLRSSTFGFIFQQTHLVSNLTLYENVVVPGYLNKQETASSVQARAQQLLEQMNVGKAQNRLPNQVSGGEAQRGAIARAMIHQPEIIFADEPTGALNKNNSEEVLDLLTDLHQSGQSILMVTHDLRAAIRGNRLIYLEDGRILDDLRLPPFQKQDVKEREETVNQWLFSLGW